RAPVGDPVTRPRTPHRERTGRAQHRPGRRLEHDVGQEEADEEAEDGGHVLDRREPSPLERNVKASVASLPTRALIAIALGAVLLYTIVLWFLLFAPTRSEAATLPEDVVATELRLADAQLQQRRPHATGGARVT